MRITHEYSSDVHESGPTREHSQGLQKNPLMSRIEHRAGLQITVGHRTMADEIATLVTRFVWPNFYCNILLYHLQIKFDFLIRYSFECTFAFMSGKIFLFSDQNGALVGHMSFQDKKLFAALQGIV